jgi:predicted RNA-binding protein with PUA domain
MDGVDERMCDECNLSVTYCTCPPEEKKVLHLSNPADFEQAVKLLRQSRVKPPLS